MNIIVCIKQVPDTQEIRWSENNTMIREGVDSILNPCDDYALELAFSIKDKYSDTKIKALTMGPPSASEVLRKAISLGADEGYLVTDKRFVGADTLATSRTLSKAIEKLGGADLIVFGQVSIDGDTAQTGPSVAQFLEVPQITSVEELECFDTTKLVAKKRLENGCQLQECPYPLVLTVNKTDAKLRRAVINDVIKSQDAKITTLTLDDLELEETQVGLKGSPTNVSKTFKYEVPRKGEILESFAQLASIIENQKKELVDE